MTAIARFLNAVKRARNPEAPSEPRTPTYAIKTPGMHETITLAAPKQFDQPTSNADARRLVDDARADGRRLALDYARKRTGKPELTWKQAKRLMDQWVKEEKAAERAAHTSHQGSSNA